MNKPLNDGRVVLQKGRLKSLRRALGVSQEKVAFLCAEKGLCISIASLKRAETNKNVLYRTANDLAVFYDVDVNELIAEASTSNDVQAHQTHKDPSPGLAVQRNFILLACQAQPESNFTPNDIVASLTHIAMQYGAAYYSNQGQNLYYTFGLDRNQGTEIDRALSFAARILHIADALYGGRAQIKIGISCAKTEIDQSCRGTAIEIKHEYLNKNNNLIQALGSQHIAIDAAVKQSLPDEYTSRALNSNDPRTSVWQVEEGTPTDAKAATTKNLRPFVGRKVELIQFKAILDSTSDYSSTHIVHLIGPAGIGKSRLSDEFCYAAAVDAFNVHTMRILDYCVETHQQAIPQLLRSLLEINAQQTSLAITEIVNSKKLTWLNETQHLPLLYSLLNWPLKNEWSSLLDAMSSERLHAMRCQLIAEIIKSKSKDKKILIRCEDYHWADQQLRSYIDGIIHQLEDVAVVFLITSRPSEEIQHLADENETHNVDVTRISLSPLPKKEALELAKGVMSASSDYQAVCIEKAQGNPLFLEQLLLDDPSVNDSALPFSLQSLITSRVDCMHEHDQLAVRSAAVIGQQFSLDLLRDLVKNPHYDPSPLVHANLIRGLGSAYTFNHALIMEGIYYSISEKDRERLHYLCSQWFENDLVLQCHHLIQAKHIEAKAKLIPAIDFLVTLFHYQEAKNLIVLGLGLMNNESELSENLADPIILTALYERLADVNVRLGDTQAAHQAFSHMLKHSKEPKERITALIGLSSCLNTLDVPSEAKEVLDKAYVIALDYKCASLLSKIHYLKGNFLFPSGQVEACFDMHQQALAYAETANDMEMQARSLGGLGDAAYAQGKMSSAYDYFSRCLAVCDEHDLKTVAAANFFMLGTVSIYLNENQKALAVTEKSIHTAELVGHKRAEVVSRLTAAWVLLDWMRLGEAFEHIEIGLKIAKEIGAKRFIPFLLESKARYYLYEDKHTDAQDTINIAVKKLNETNSHSFIGPWLLSTQAMLASSWADAEYALSQGQTHLQQGCVGHNYFRFYVTAIEVCLRHNKQTQAQHYIEQLKVYTQAQPVPWANFYIRRAELLCDKAESNKNWNDDLHALIQEAKHAKLYTSMPLLNDSLRDIVAL